MAAKFDFRSSPGSGLNRKMAGDWSSWQRPGRRSLRLSREKRPLEAHSCEARLLLLKEGNLQNEGLDSRPRPTVCYRSSSSNFFVSCKSRVRHPSVNEP